MIGTPAYMAPEQAAGHVEKQSATSDIFSLGLLLYELATLQAAYEDAADALACARAGRVPAIRALPGEDVPWELQAVVTKATERDGSARYQDAAALGDDLRSVLLGDPVSAAPDGLIQGWQRWLAQHRQFTFALIWFLLLLGLLGLAWGHLNTERALELAALEAQIEEEALGAFAMRAAERGSVIELEFGLLAGEVRGWGAGVDSCHSNRGSRHRWCH